MVKSLIHFRIHGILLLRKQRLKFLCDQDCIAHLVLGISRMHAASRHGKLRGGCIEILILQLAQCAAVYRIRKIRAEPCDVKMIRAASDLFIRRKPNADLAVRNLRML